MKSDKELPRSPPKFFHTYAPEQTIYPASTTYAGNQRARPQDWGESTEDLFVFSTISAWIEESTKRPAGALIESCGCSSCLSAFNRSAIQMALQYFTSKSNEYWWEQRLALAEDDLRKTASKGTHARSRSDTSPISELKATMETLERQQALIAELKNSTARPYQPDLHRTTNILEKYNELRLQRIASRKRREPERATVSQPQSHANQRQVVKVLSEQRGALPLPQNLLPKPVLKQESQRQVLSVETSFPEPKTETIPIYYDKRPRYEAEPPEDVPLPLNIHNRSTRSAEKRPDPDRSEIAECLPPTTFGQDPFPSRSEHEDMVTPASGISELEAAIQATYMPPPEVLAEYHRTRAQKMSADGNGNSSLKLERAKTRRGRLRQVLGIPNYPIIPKAQSSPMLSGTPSSRAQRPPWAFPVPQRGAEESVKCSPATTSKHFTTSSPASKPVITRPTGNPSPPPSPPRANASGPAVSAGKFKASGFRSPASSNYSPVTSNNTPTSYAGTPVSPVETPPLASIAAPAVSLPTCPPPKITPEANAKWISILCRTLDHMDTTWSSKLFGLMDDVTDSYETAIDNLKASSREGAKNSASDETVPTQPLGPGTGCFRELRKLHAARALVRAALYKYEDEFGWPKL